MKKMSKIILGIGGVTIAAVGAVIGLSNKKPPKYSSEWIKKLSDSDWEKEREIIRQKFCSPLYDTESKIKFQSILGLFDKIKSEKDWAGLIPHGPSYHGEHGTNLYKKN